MPFVGTRSWRFIALTEEMSTKKKSLNKMFKGN